MEKFKVTGKLLTLAATLLLVAAHVYAQPGSGYGRGHGRGEGPRMGPGNGPMEGNRMGAWLDLSDEQVEKIEDLRLEFQKTILPVRNGIGEKQARLHTLLTTDNASQNEVDQLAEDIGALKVTIHKARINHHQKVRALLTEEQRVKFDSHFRGGFGPGSGQGFGMGPGGGNRHHGMHGRGWY